VTQYQLYVVNNAPGSVLDFCLFHAPPDPNDVRDGTLAWLVKRAHQGVMLRFSWADTYAFAWRPDADATFELAPADPSTVPANVAKLDHTGSGYTLTTGVPLDGAAPGTLYLEQSAAVPASADVGFAMDGACLYSEAATPGGQATFDTAAGYWLVAGTFAQGAAVDVTVATAAQQVEFPTGVTAMTATLDGLDDWHVAPGAPRT
jgi:hypothetical protein